MIKLPFKEIRLQEVDSSVDKGVDHDFTTIVLDPDDNVFKTITGKFSDKKDCYEKLSKRGFVVRKSFETKIYDWILKNAKTTFDAYLMLSTAFSKWKGNNVLDDYYVQLLNDIPSVNRERQKGNPNTKGNPDLPLKKNKIDEDFDVPENSKTGYSYGMKRSAQRQLYRNPDQVNFNDTLDIRVLTPEEIMELTGKQTPEEAHKAIMHDEDLKNSAIDLALSKKPIDTLKHIHLEPMVKGINSLEDPKILINLRDRLNNSDETNETVWVMSSPINYISPVIMTPEQIYNTYKSKVDNKDYVWGRHKELNRNTFTNADKKALNKASDGRLDELSKEAAYWTDLKTNPEKIKTYPLEAIKAAGGYKNFFDTGAYKNTKVYEEFVNNLTQAKNRLEQIYNTSWDNFDPDNKEDRDTINRLRNEQLSKISKERMDIIKTGKDLGIINNAEILSPEERYSKIKDRIIAPGNPKKQGTDDVYISYLDQRERLRELIKNKPSKEYFDALRKLNDQKPIRKKTNSSPIIAGNRQQSKKSINDYKNAYNHKDESVSISKTRAMVEAFVNQGATQLYASEHNPFNSSKSFLGTVVTEKIQNELNNDLFENGKIKPEIKKALLKIADEFEKTLEMPIKPIDVYFTGSNANYNYGENSDIDIHLVYDFTQLQDQALENFNDLIEDYLKAKKNVFNTEYEIKVKGKPVEVGCEDFNSPLISTGVYSLNQDSWIRKPEKVKVDDSVNEQAYRAILSLIDKRISTGDASAIKRLWDGIREIRKNSLAKEGEFGEGNLIFKKLRNEGHLAKIKEKYAELKGQELSLESLEEME